MKLIFRTKVNQDAQKVFEGFDEQLFQSLSPPFPKVHLIHFGGSKTGDLVSLELDFLFFKQHWESEIVEDGKGDYGHYFIDHGVRLPFFLTSWSHRHEINALPNGSEIVDSIEYKSGTLLMDLLLYPGMLLQFGYRKPVYKKYFN